MKELDKLGYFVFGRNTHQSSRILIVFWVSEIIFYSLYPFVRRFCLSLYTYLFTKYTNILVSSLVKNHVNWEKTVVRNTYYQYAGPEFMLGLHKKGKS